MLWLSCLCSGWPALRWYSDVCSYLVVAIVLSSRQCCKLNLINIWDSTISLKKPDFDQLEVTWNWEIPFQESFTINGTPMYLTYTSLLYSTLCIVFYSSCICLFVVADPSMSVVMELNCCLEMWSYYNVNAPYTNVHVVNRLNTSIDKSCSLWCQRWCNLD